MNFSFPMKLGVQEFTDIIGASYCEFISSLFFLFTNFQWDSSPFVVILTVIEIIESFLTFQLSLYEISLIIGLILIDRHANSMGKTV